MVKGMDSLELLRKLKDNNLHFSEQEGAAATLERLLLINAEAFRLISELKDEQAQASRP